MQNFLLALGVSLSLVIASPQASRAAADSTVAPVSASASNPKALVATVVDVDQVYQGLPTRAPEPRTMREFWPFFAGFAAAWLGITAYLLSLGRRWSRAASLLEDQKIIR